MKYAYFRFHPVVAVDRFENTVVVTDEGRNIVLLQGTDSIPTMVSEIVDNQVEIVRKERPEGIIEINRQTVAVAQDEPWARWISMTAQSDDGVIVYANVASGKWLGYFPNGFWSRGQCNPDLICEQWRQRITRCQGLRATI